MKKLLAALTLGIAGFGIATPAMAQTAGQWSIKTKVIPSGADWNVLQICVKDDNTWYSTEQRKGSGRWLLAGNRVLFHGALEVLSIGADLRLTSATQMTGNLQQWVNTSLVADNQSNLFATSDWTWVSATCKRAF